MIGRATIPVAMLLLASVFACATRRTASEGRPPVTDDHPVPVDMATTAYRCTDGYEFIVLENVVSDGVDVFLADRTIYLPPLEADRGERYGDDTVTLRVAGREAVIQDGDEVHAGCRVHSDRTAWMSAAFNGVGWRGVGVDPGWVVEIVEVDGIVLLTNDGRHRYEYPGPPDMEDPSDHNVFRAAEGDEIVVHFWEEPCVVAGQELDHRVVVQHEGRLLHGCGRRLR